MTPSRAVLIFKAKEGETAGHAHHKREALPWWIFGVLVGVLTLWLWPQLPFRPADVLRLPAAWLELPADPETLNEMETWRYWLISSVHFLPGLLVGLIVGLFVIRPVNAVLGWLFRGFNRFFDW